VCKAFLTEHPEVEGIGGLRYWFLQRLFQILDSRKIKMAGWEEVGLKMTRVGRRETKEPYQDLANKNVSVNAWNSTIGGGAEDTGYKLANNGYLTVLSFVNYLYFDMAQSAETDVPGAYWGGMVDLKTAYEVCPLDFTLATRKNGQGERIDRSTAFQHSVKLTDEGIRNVVGIQGQIWSETVQGPKMLQEYLFPRTLALAERAWASQPAWETNGDERQRDEQIDVGYAQFVATLGARELTRLGSQGIHYYLPRPGVKQVDGKVYANSEFSCLTIRYTTDGTAPTSTSAVYEKPFAAKSSIKLATFDANGRSSRVIKIDRP
jgi:hexosaminidase